MGTSEPGFSVGDNLQYIFCVFTMFGRGIPIGCMPRMLLGHWLVLTFIVLCWLLAVCLRTPFAATVVQ